jgi:hypothetical protein
MPNPFGIELGSTPQDKDATYSVTFRSPARPHPAFSTYTGAWSPTEGLVAVTATTDAFEDDDFGTRTMETYDALKAQLAQVYGPFKEVRYVEDHIDEDDDGFLYHLEENERRYSSTWNGTAASRLDANIDEIILTVAATEPGPVVLLEYRSKRFNKITSLNMIGMDTL